jgi:hypothetical protein
MSSGHEIGSAIRPGALKAKTPTKMVVVQPRAASLDAQQQQQHQQQQPGSDDEDDASGAAFALAMHAAVVANRADMVETLLVGEESDGRADPNALVKGGKRPLGLAAAAGLYDITASLLAHGADPSLNDENGDTPLHLAAARGHVALARLLIDAGATPSVRNRGDLSPAQLATSPQMKTLLRAAESGEELPPRLEGEEEDDDEGEEEAAARGLAGGANVLSSRSQNGANNDGAGNGASGRGAGGKPTFGGAGALERAQAPAAEQARPPVPFGPPPLPLHALGDTDILADRLDVRELTGELQQLLNATETDIKRLLVVPSGLLHEVQCDVMRVGKGNTYRCYLRLGGTNERRVCIFEATRTRKGKLKNSQYRIMLPSGDSRFVPTEYGPVHEMSEEALDTALYCGKVRSYNLSGANFVAYDDGYKPETTTKQGFGGNPPLRPRRQLVAMCFNKSTSRRVPMTMRMLLPSPRLEQTTAEQADLLESLQRTPLEQGQEAPPPEGTHLLKLVPPRWNADEQMFQLFCEGRACCMSNKNVQLADTSKPDEAALQVGKLRANLFNVDMNGCVSPFQAFAAALAVFDQSSVRRRF